METGLKIPNWKDGGNREDIFEPESEAADLGEISRNVRMSIAFSEMMNFHIAVKSVEFKESLVISFELRGCANIKNMSSPRNKFTQKIKYHMSSNLYKVDFEVQDFQGDSMEVTISCELDQNEGEHKLP